MNESVWRCEHEKYKNEKSKRNTLSKNGITITGNNGIEVTYYNKYRQLKEKNPKCRYIDNSKKIDSKEAIFLGLALSLDSFGIGIGGSIGSINLVFFPIFVSILQLFFICSGIWLGENINNLYKLPENIWSVISGILLIGIGIVKIFL